MVQVLEQIQRNVTAGYYKNQYAFEAELQLLVNQIHDGHVELSAGIMAAFSFASPYGLVSASVDGEQPPEVYLAEHIVECQGGGCQPSPISKINGEDVVDYLTKFAELNSGSYLEPHADWNALMDSPAQDIQATLSTFQAATFYPGNELNFTLKNGTLLETHWLAIYNGIDDTGPLTTGGDFYNVFVLGLLPANFEAGDQWWPEPKPGDDGSQNGNSSDENTDPWVCSRGKPALENWCSESYGAYPNNPIVAQPGLESIGGGVVTGYLLEDIFTGVLSIPSFQQFGEDTENFQDAVNYFIGNVSNAKMSKIIIDLQGNTGGTVFLAFNTFKQFFYAMDPYAASRIRSHELANILGGAFSKWWDSLEHDPDGNEGANEVNYQYHAADEWVVTNRINPATQTDFSSWSEYYGPVPDHGDSFSLPQRYNLSDEIFDAAAFGDWIPLGYGRAVNPGSEPQAFAAEDIVILTDGFCSSACTLFVEMMAHQAGVKTVVVGGRPVTGPMQAISGTRGASVYSADALDNDFDFVNSTIGNATATSLLPSRQDSGMWTTYAGFNIRDQVREGDSTPLQFKYEAADCRIYYTLSNVYNMTQLWRDAAAAWKDSSLCIEGSTGYPTARNTTSDKNPPERTSQAPGLNLDLANKVNFNINGTLGLMDGISPTLLRTGDIVPCSAGCLGGTSCESIDVRCPNGNFIPIMACLPHCKSSDKLCPGTNPPTKCDLNSKVESKSNIFNAGDASLNTKFSLSLKQGHCKPANGNIRLGCGR